MIRREGGDARLEAPRVYQEIAGREQAVEASFVLRGANRAGFAIGSYDPTRELVIDPVLFFSTYFGGTGDEHSSSVTVDGSGNIYLAGSTTSPQLPKGISTTVLQSAPAGLQNVYIAKINPILNPAALEYVTYLGGNGMDAPVGIGVDGAGNPMVAGTTSSTNFPTQNGYQSAPEAGSTGTQHVFVTKLNAAAQMLLYSTYLSGSVNDIASGMTTDGSGNVYVTGTTTSTNPQDVGTATGHQFPSSSIPFTPTPFQSTPLNAIQFFVTKVSTLNSGKSSIAYSTYFGGANTANSTTPVVAVGGGIAVDTNGNIYFDGTTNFTYTNGAVGDFPILNAYQPCLDQPPPTVVSNPPPPCTGNSTATATDAFLAKLNPNPGVAQGQQLQWSSYFGGAETDSAAGIALDSGAANVYIVGTTNSPGITGSTSAASFQPCLDGLVDPTTKACTATSPAASDAFVARLTNPVLSTTNAVNNISLTYFSYLGGSNNEAGLAITVDSASGAVVTGWTTSSDFPVFPTPGSVQSKLTGMQDAFVARLDTVISTSQSQNQTGSWATYYGGTNTITPGVLATTQGTTIALDVNQNTYFAGDTNAVDLQVTGFPQGTNGGGYDAFVTELQTTANLSITGVLTLGTNQAYINAGNQATFTYTLTNNGPDLASNITVTDDISPSVTIVPVNFESANATSGTCGGGSTTTGVSCIVSSLQAGSTATVTIVLTPKAFPNGSAATFNGGAVQVLGPNNSVLATTSVSANMSDFAISVTPPNRSVPAAGDTATYAVQLTPNPVYTTGIALSCTGLPTGATCSFSPSSVNLQGPSPGVATLSISTQARPITTGRAKFGSRRFYAVWLAVPGLGLLGVGIGSDRRRRRILGILMLCMLFALLLLQPACSSSSTAPPTTGTPAGTYPITVTATSGTSDTKSQGIQLTVP